MEKFKHNNEWNIDKTNIAEVKAFARQKCAEFLSGPWHLANEDDIIIKKISYEFVNIFFFK